MDWHSSFSVIRAYSGEISASDGIASATNAPLSYSRLNSSRLSIRVPHLPLVVPTENRISNV